MPALAEGKALKKRKLDRDGGENISIHQLEDQVSESRKYYNNIATLLGMLHPGPEANLTVAVSLCRIFCRLIAVGSLSDAGHTAQNEKIIVAWLRERFQDYQKALLTIIRDGNASSQVCSAPSLVVFVCLSLADGAIVYGLEFVYALDP